MLSLTLVSTVELSTACLPTHGQRPYPHPSLPSWVVLGGPIICYAAQGFLGHVVPWGCFALYPLPSALGGSSECSGPSELRAYRLLIATPT